VTVPRQVNGLHAVTETVDGGRGAVQQETVPVRLHLLVASVADSHWTVEVLLRHRSVEVGTVGTEHLATVPGTQRKS